MALKKEKTEISLKSSIEPSYPISKIATSHVRRLKRLETRVIKNHVFYNEESKGTVSYIPGVKCGSVVAARYETMKNIPDTRLSHPIYIHI